MEFRTCCNFCIHTSMDTLSINLFCFSYTQYPAYSRVGRRNLVLRHAVPHFASNFQDIACWVAKLRFFLLPEQGNKNNLLLRVVIKPTTVAFTIQRYSTMASLFLYFGRAVMTTELWPPWDFSVRLHFIY